MAGGAFARFGGRMFDFGFLKKIVMALEAEFCPGARQQSLALGGMGIMTAEAFARFGGRVFDFGLFQKIVVTFEAKLLSGVQKQEFVGRLVRMMAGGAFARLDGRMFDLHWGHEIFMTAKANIPHFPLHLLREFRFVAIAALFIEKWFVAEDHGFGPNRRLDKRRGGSGRFVGGGITQDRSCHDRRVRRRDAVEEKAK